MIDVDLARQLLDFGKRIGPGQRADDQLKGAVAIHNILRRHHVAYLADEVGMGKTYVALGAIALFRHFNPRFRVLFLAPRQNIQRKWIKEMRNFVATNVLFPDLRIKGFDGLPARELIYCQNLTGLVHEAALNPDRDFFCRLPSFSLPVSGDDAGRSDEAARLRIELRRRFPWLPNEVFDLRNKQAFKDNVARAICCVMPTFDLVVVDEGHNLKHGFSETASSRNRVLGLVFGHPEGLGDRKLFENYGSRAKAVLFLSATPVEETYTHLWNQLNVFGRGDGFEDLKEPHVGEDEKKKVAAQFLVRRVTEIRINGDVLTKNLYRREWRSGGVATHDHPIHLEGERQRLIVALVQKKVSELLQGQRFNHSFQIGMLASFESFLATAKLKTDDSETSNFDDVEQTDDLQEREGVDVADLNQLAHSYRNEFGGRELPHPKMDAITMRLSQAWKTGEKSLVFVRRVASVKELKRKLDETYNEWLFSRLRSELPSQVQKRLERAIERYLRDRLEALNRGVDDLGNEVRIHAPDDFGGTDTFFAWFFRGKTPLRILSGPLVRQRYSAPQSPYFEDNYASMVLGCEPRQVAERMSAVIGADVGRLREELRRRSAKHLRPTRKFSRGQRFVAVQAAAIEWLKEIAGAHQALANAVWHERFERERPVKHATEAPDVGMALENRTFFTELRRRPTLREKIWPQPTTQAPVAFVREQELRGRLLTAAARLGHAFVDLYIATISRIGSLRIGAGEAGDDDNDSAGPPGITEFLDRLERQMNEPLGQRPWSAFDELSEIAANFDLILDVNAHETRAAPLEDAARRFGTLLSRQQPAAGMAGQVNRTLVSQFRMPGYPLVLVSTDLLQEGEDLHTFCSSVYHYGISWTPSSMEQRIGRIDRVRSQTDRRLASLGRMPDDAEKLQVYFPHLQDTIEVVQVQRVLTRMNTFLRLMHEGLILPDEKDRRIDLRREMLAERPAVPQIRERLQTAFAVQPDTLKGTRHALAVSRERPERVQRWFESLVTAPLPGVEMRWEKTNEPGRLYGTVFLGDRQQPFSLLLRSIADRIIVRCISPIGQVLSDDGLSEVESHSSAQHVRIGAIRTEDKRTYDLTIEDDVLVQSVEAVDTSRVAWLTNRVTVAADDLERALLPGQDHPLEVFKEDLAKEGRYEE